MNVAEALKKMSLNARLAALLLLFGFIAIFAGDPYGGAKTEIDAQELALIVDRQVDHVAAEELADWIIQNRSDYRLIDLRTEKEYDEYHIPTSENITLAGLMDAGLQRNEKIVLYSEGGIHSAQAWFLLKARGYKAVYMLFGGLEEWKDKVLFPAVPENPTPEQRVAFAKIKEVSTYFGGTPQSNAAAVTAQPQTALPKLSLPAGGTGPKPQGKKKKEGC
ncbi:MAG TPA: rhodanese-like domain-containing protein [bacterium]|nr:rhodanese-like domain-containing protein [bacterium]HQG45337.1 rhodanese-like domain-containing protein [bacterium]HQJ65617.1 rhodanese-like domain-containing protein [bacterium]